MQRREFPKALLSSSAALLLAQNAKAAVVPEESRKSGNVRHYGARGDGNNDDTSAIQNALDLGQSVYLPKGTYRVTRTLRLKASGQTLSGEGTGSTDSPALTRILYAGKPKGKVISVSTGKVHVQQCTIRNLEVDGNNLANKGIELYDTAVPGGAWRNRVYDTAVLNCTNGANATGIFLGSSDFPNFAHDSIVFGCYIHNCTRGLWGRGAKYQIYSTTLFGCEEAGICAEPGSAWTVQGSIFTSNGCDFHGSNIQQADFSGCWFENSAHGIYRAKTAHSVSFTGCFLHTNNRATLMDFGGAAGYHFIGGHFVPTNTASLKIVNVNAGAVGSVLGQPLSLTYADSDQEVPLILPPAQTGTGAVRSASAQLKKGQTLVLRLGRGVFFVGVDVWKADSFKVRQQASYTAFLFDGDNEAVEEIASRAGSGGTQMFTLAPSHNSVTLTYTGSDMVNAYMSGTGTVG
jgi:hypothetical protein